MTLTRKNVSIKTNELNKVFDTIHAVRDLNLEVPTGTRFGFLGPNGAGKTTTVRMLSGLLTPTSGSATVCGLDVVTQKDEVKAITGLLPESPGVYQKLSAVEFLEFIGALNDLSGSGLHQRIDRLLGVLGLESRQDDLLESYSSGMKQKVLVASTLLHDPQVVFLDEPTSRLDPAASVLVKELIVALTQESNTSFFICTHQTSFAEDVCDVIGILNDGVLRIVGSPEEIINQAGGADLEEAYLKIVGGKIDQKALLTWRN